MQTFRRANKPNSSKLESGFRLIPMFSIDHNAQRLRHHIEFTIKRSQAHQRWARRLRLKKRIRAGAGSGVAG